MATSTGYAVVVWSGDASLSPVWDQTKRLFEDVGSGLEGLECSWEDVVLVYLYLSHMDNYRVINRLYADHFTVNPPARYVVRVNTSL